MSCAGYSPTMRVFLNAAQLLERRFNPLVERCTSFPTWPRRLCNFLALFFGQGTDCAAERYGYGWALAQALPSAVPVATLWLPLLRPFYSQARRDSVVSREGRRACAGVWFRSEEHTSE